MADYLETTVDKFIFRVATDRFYNSEGVWAKPEGGLVRIGLADFGWQQLNQEIGNPTNAGC